MSIVRKLKGQNGLIILHDTYLEISRKTVGGFLTQGGASGNRRFYLKDISGIEYKKPSLWSNGYIKVLVHGTKDVNAKVGILGSSEQSMQDQNTVVLSTFSKKKINDADDMHKQIMKLFSKAKSATTGESSSRMDELSKLAELHKSGILTEEEFQREKAKLLNS